MTEPKRGDIKVENGKRLCFVENDDKGQVWEILGPADTPKPTPPLPLEEQIARVIAPGAYWGDPDTNAEQQDALTKARQIIALFPKGGSGEAVLWGLFNPDTNRFRAVAYQTQDFAEDKARQLTDNYTAIEARPLFAHPAPKDRGSELLDRVHLAATDPGQFAGYKGDRSLGQWMRDALAVALAASPSPRDKGQDQ